jgi:hypothetical protein
MVFWAIKLMVSFVYADCGFSSDTLGCRFNFQEPFRIGYHGKWLGNVHP